ncbi:hypothetical protein [Arthrobacter sp. ISL-65]|uniref:hypothetical protein n=1 Tax=Arthrobacter sp. ISL-65 TaxID=2819112 RepID=UPI001BE60CE2|nr:hypothetical protein [Arthrobacter sp. ISL-65]MBT2551210.1 hypothetical protein [Arthrobacter sp. ISL-65]
MKRSHLAMTMIPLVVLLAGCAQAGEAAQNAASSAVSQAANAAAGQVKGQICAIIEDGLVSASDKAALAGLVAGAETAGVPADITGPLRAIAQAGDQVPSDSVDDLQKACAAA